MISYARLNISTDITSIQSEVAALTGAWKPHFNVKHYEGEWTVLSLRGTGDENQIIPDQINNQDYKDTGLMEACPSIKKLADSFQCPLLSIRLLNLKSGAIIKEHRDHELAFEMGEARLHFPVFTNDGVEFFVDDERIIMQQGECWYINANLPHRVANYGNTDRIHLVIDCKVNEWLQQLFDSGEKKYESAAKQNEQLVQVIQELRLQNTTMSLELANQLEKQLDVGS